MRIGAPPQPPKKARPALVAVIIGSAVVLVALGAAYGLGWLGPKPLAATASPSASANVENQIECATIRHEYESWSNPTVGLDDLPRWQRADAKFHLNQLSEDGEALLKAVSGHPDQASKTLAVAVAEYNFEVSLVGVEVQLGGDYSQAAYNKALAAHDKVEAAYGDFVKATCP